MLGSAATSKFQAGVAQNGVTVSGGRALSEGRESQRGCSDISIFGGEFEEYEDWQYKVRFFLNSECFLFARFPTMLESLDREIDLEDVHGAQIRCFTNLFGMVLVFHGSCMRVLFGPFFFVILW